jgi:uncharacterized protein
MSNLAPGTYVQESAFPTFNPVNTAAGSAFVFVGAHNRGPLTPQLVQSWGQFLTLYGGFSSTTAPSLLALAVYTFFNNGGSQCRVLRLAHSDAVDATATLESAGSAATLNVKAINPGAWGDNISVVVSENASGSFNLAVYYGGGTLANQLAEPVWTNLSMDPANSRYAPTIINNPQNGSSFINVTDANGTPGSGSPVPAAATTALTAGLDGGAVVAADMVASQAQLATLKEPLVVNFPGVYDATGVLGPMLSYLTTGRNFADSILVCDPQAAQSVTAVEAYAATIGTSSYATVYYPWITVADPASNVPGALRSLPPGAAAMAKWSVNDATRGVWKAPAGYGTALNVLNTEVMLSNTDVGNLVAAGVNPIIFKEGAGIVIWGARTLSNQTSTVYLNKRRALIYVESQLKALSDYAAFEDNDFILWTQLSQRLGGFLNQLWASGAFAGTTAADSYFLTCDESNNDPNSDIVHINAGVALASPAEFILIQVGQWVGGTTVSEISPATV